MPKSKVRKKPASATVSRAVTQTVSQSAGGTRVRVAGPSSPIYIGLMLGLMILGLLWLVVYYLWGQDISFMASIGNWNFAIGFVLMIGGLLMTMRWR